MKADTRHQLHCQSHRKPIVLLAGRTCAQTRCAAPPQVEDLLEYYMQRAATLQSESERLLAGARDLEESVGVSLSARRFEVRLFSSSAPTAARLTPSS